MLELLKLLEACCDFFGSSLGAAKDGRFGSG